MFDIAILDTAILIADRLAFAVLFAVGIAGMWLASRPSEHTILSNTVKLTTDLSVIALIATTGLVLLLRTAALADVPLNETLPYVQKVVEKSQYGSTWLGRVSVLAAIISLWLWLRQRQTVLGYGLISFAIAATALFISSASHAGENGLWTIENICNTLHILAGALWGGSVILYALLIRQLSSQNALISDAANRLTQVATLALVTVLITGILNAWFRLELVSDLWSNNYGITLSIKIFFVLVMMSIGALNRFFIIPAVIQQETSPTSQQALNPVLLFRRGLYFDSVIFTSVLVLAVTLATLSPSH